MLMIISITMTIAMMVTMTMTTRMMMMLTMTMMITIMMIMMMTLTIPMTMIMKMIMTMMTTVRVMMPNQLEALWARSWVDSRPSRTVECLGVYLLAQGAKFQRPWHCEYC